MRNFAFMAFVFAALSAVAFAQAGGLDNVTFAVTELCVQAKQLMPVIVFLMVLLAGIVYVAGQVFGAEVRSRANVWATAMIIGAIICVLVILIVPNLLAMAYNDPDAVFAC